ncbi:EFR1 family ferrodoxin [Oscillospiraceae bacterium PP1C4]
MHHKTYWVFNNARSDYMDNLSRIFWFSGTGNSLYAAKRLSAELSDLPLSQMAGGATFGSVGGEGAKIGFVFPSYYGNLPRAVRAFVEKLDVKPGTYLFAVVTMGGAGQGSVAALDKALREKGLRLSYGRGLMMPANYVIKYNPADLNKSAAVMDKVDKRVHEFANEIVAGAQKMKTFPITANNLYKNIEALDAAFTVSDNCTGCGLCERICPAKNIRLENGKLEWLHHCEHCVACISWCPVRAIEYGDRTQSRRRYRNPRIQADELTRQK